MRIIKTERKEKVEDRVNESKKQVKCYLRPRVDISDGAFLALFVIIAIASGPAVLLFALIPCLWILKKYNEVKVFDEEFDKMNEADFSEMIRQFEHGRQYFSDKLRLGSTYVFARNSGLILRYTDISSVYQHVLKRNLVEAKRWLKIKDSSGKEQTLCRIPIRGEGDKEVTEVVMLMKLFNSSIRIGASSR